MTEEVNMQKQSLKGNGFLSKNALMKAHITKTVGWMQGTLIEVITDKGMGADYALNYQDYTEKGKMALLARCVGVEEPLEAAVVIDAVDALSQCARHGAIDHMAEDVRQWGQFQMPYPSTLLKLQDEYVALIYRLHYDNDDNRLKGDPLWNVWLFTDAYNVEGSVENMYHPSNEVHDPWSPTKTFFQIGGSDEGYQVAFDTALEEDLSTNRHLLSMASHHFKQISAFLFLLEHRKIKECDARVPTRTNSKRIKTKRLPYNEYKVAVLGDYATTDSKKEKGTGTHASPKMHFVVGHWHRFQKKTKLGKLKTWIHAYVKGDPSLGIVTKEYRLMENEDEHDKN